MARFDVYATLGIERYWIVRGDADADEIDGMTTMRELRNGAYEVTGHRLVPKLGG